MRRGVTMWDPASTYVDADVELAEDVSLLPGTIVKGSCRIDAGAQIGPNALLIDVIVGARAQLGHRACDAARGSARTPRSARSASSARAPTSRRGRASARTRRSGSEPDGATPGRSSLRRVEVISKHRLEFVSGRSHPDLARDIAGHLERAALCAEPPRVRQRRDPLPLRGLDAWRGRLHPPDPLRPGERLADGAADHDRRGEARVGEADHSRLPVLRVLAPGPQVDGPRADHREARRRHAAGGRRGPRHVGRPALRTDPGLLRRARSTT